MANVGIQWGTNSMDFIWPPIGIQRSSNPSNSDDSRDSRVRRWVLGMGPANTRQGGQRNATGLIAEHRHALLDTRDFGDGFLFSLNMMYFLCSMREPRAVSAAARRIGLRTESGERAIDVAVLGNQVRGVALSALARVGGTLPGIRAQIYMETKVSRKKEAWDSGRHGTNKDIEQRRVHRVPARARLMHTFFDMPVV
ncbi:hypothetical protein B0H17DRAFT_1149920 [Mycena rosella]|uniref:Uncharacterized protein n=1 Tax=Mycena rosella TaxID=1033263 RepID=A0AAD7FN33_MYCRO|nr:hypothetical protein B0H17DRAFT_1149920 [Mycena rosella]